MAGTVEVGEKRKKALESIIARRRAARLEVIPKPVTKEVKREAELAATEAERNAVRVAQSFVDHFNDAFERTAEGRRYKATKIMKSEIGNLLFTR